MKSKTACVSVLVRFVIFSIAVSGCSEVQTASHSEVGVNHTHLLLNDIQVVDVAYHRDGGELVVSGKVRRSCNFCYDDVLGHIDIALVDSAGRVLETTSVHYTPRSIPKDGPRYSTFTARLDSTPPAGAMIRTAYHEHIGSTPSGSYTKAFDCEDNLAVPAAKTEGVAKKAR